MLADVKKVIRMTAARRFIALIVYPVLHEFGHAFTAMVVGASVIEFHLFPIPNVLCDMNGLGDAENIVIGLCGMLFPFFISMIIRPHGFWIWYMNSVLKGICLLSFLLSGLAIITNEANILTQNNDIFRILQIWDGSKWLCLIALIIFIIMLIVSITKSHPVEKCLKYFDVI